MAVFVSALGQETVRVTKVVGVELGVLRKRYPRLIGFDRAVRVNQQVVPDTYTMKNGDLIIGVPEKIVGCPVNESHVHLDDLPSYFKNSTDEEQRKALIGKRIVAPMRDPFKKKMKKSTTKRA